MPTGKAAETTGRPVAEEPLSSSSILRAAPAAPAACIHPVAPQQNILEFDDHHPGILGADAAKQDLDIDTPMVDIDTPMVEFQEVSKKKRTLCFLLACSHVLLSSGVVFGWTALHPVLRDSGLFDAYDETTTPTRSSLMNTVATMGMAGNALCKLPLGCLLDMGGPRTTAMVGGGMLTAGSLLIGLCDKNDTILPVLGYLLLGMAGPCVLLPTFQFTQLFGENKASAMAYLVALFQLSTGIFWVFEKLNENHGLGRTSLFVGYAGVGCFILATSAAFWPDTPHSAPPSDQISGVDSLPARSHHLMGKPLLKQIQSVEFLYLLCFLSLHTFRLGFLFGTLGPQVEDFFPVKEGDFLVDMFNIILPLGFIPMTGLTALGLTGFLLVRPSVAFIATSLLNMVYGLLLLVHTTPAYIILFFLFSLSVQFTYSTFYSFAANTFGYASFGRIAGVASAVAGLVQLLQTGLISLTDNKFFHPASDASANWITVDLLLGTVPVLLLIYPSISWIRERKSKVTPDKGEGDATAEAEGMEQGGPDVSLHSPFTEEEAESIALDAQCMEGMVPWTAEEAPLIPGGSPSVRPNGSPFRRGGRRRSSVVSFFGSAASPHMSSMGAASPYRTSNGFWEGF